MKLAISLDGRITLSDMIELARMADEAGFHSVWPAEHLGYREAVTASMAYLGETRKVRVAPTALSPYVAHPLFWAMGISTLAEYAPGRVMLAVGTANPNVLGEMGIALKKPLTRIREMIESIQRLWEAEGSRIEFGGETVQLKGVRLDFRVPKSIPIYIAAMGPKMCELSGEAADGVLLTAGGSSEYIAWALEHVRKGQARCARGKENFTVASFIFTSVTKNYEEALDASQKGLAYLLRSPAQQPNLDVTGTKLDKSAINDAFVREDWEAVKRLIPEEVVHAHTVTGTPEMAVDRIKEYSETGLEILVLSLRGTAENRKKAFRLLAERLRLT
ncbi:MAG: LLM class flavin-dependent oxidoreductase [Nitrospinota bacterium]